MTYESDSARLLHEIVSFYETEVKTAKITNFNFLEGAESSITIEYQPEYETRWDYFREKLSESMPQIRSHKNREKNSLVSIFDRYQNAEQQLSEYLALLKKRYFEITKPNQRHLTVIFKETNRCNLDCKFCYDKPFRDALGHIKHLDFASVEKFIRLARDYTEELTLTWHGGEPTMAGLDFYEKVYQEIIPKYPQLKIESTMQTNGTLLNDDWFKLFRKYDIGVGSSYQAKSWDIRGEDTKGKKISSVTDTTVLDNIAKARGYDMNIGVIDVITTEDLDHIKEKADFYKHYPLVFEPHYRLKRGIRRKRSGLKKEKKALKNAHFHDGDGRRRERQVGVSFCLNEVFESGAAKGTGLNIHGKNSIDYFAEKAKEYFHSWIFDQAGQSDRFGTQYLAILGQAGARTCYYGDCMGNYISINSNGDMYHCDRPYMEKYRLGNINDFESLREVYNSEAFHNFERERAEKLENYCSKCDLFPLCQGFCPLIDIDRYGSANRPDPDKCALRRKIFDALFDELCKVKSLSECNPEIQRWVRRYNRYLPCEIERIAEDLKIKSILDAFEMDKTNTCMGLKYSKFIAFNPSAEIAYLSKVYLPVADDNKRPEFLSDERRIEVLKDRMKQYVDDFRKENKKNA